jgi:SAM-dependent methyltransferase
MDARTLRHYAEHAREYAKRYESTPSPFASRLASSFVAGGRLLDVGFGSGRDLAALLAAGYEAFGVEPVEALRAEALAAHPELAGRIDAGALPLLGRPFGGEFDGVLCSAVLMHLPDEALFDAAYALRAVLRVHGRLLLSVPSEPRDVDYLGQQ